MEIIGGLESLIPESVSTIVSGGDAHVVGQSAVENMRRRALWLTNGLDTADEKKLLSIIGMSQPIAFGTIEYDDGDSGYIIPRAAARLGPEEKLIEALKDRLRMPPAKVVSILVREFDLDRAVYLALGEFINVMVEKINSALSDRGKPPLATIMIAPAIGELIPFVKADILEVSSSKSAATKYPNSFAALIEHIILISKKYVSVEPREIRWPAQIVEYPKLQTENIESAAPAGQDVKSYIEAIIMRENRLGAYLVSLEEYNVRLGVAIQEYMRAMSEFFPPPK
jgi:hypothetical protein